MRKKFLFIGVMAILVLAAGPGLILAAAQKKNNPPKSAKSASKPTAGKPAAPNVARRQAAKSATDKNVFAAGTYYDPQSSAYIQLSSYFLFPNQDFTVTGSYFAPGEQVEVLAAGISKTVIADNRGNFAAGPFGLSMPDIGSIVEVTAEGKTSGVMRTANLTVGSYYPAVAPESYYARAGSETVFVGKNFAPNEPVSIRSGNTDAGTVVADAGGSFGFRFRLQDSPGTQGFVFTGKYTQSPVNVNITVYR